MDIWKFSRKDENYEWNPACLSGRRKLCLCQLLSQGQSRGVPHHPCYAGKRVQCLVWWGDRTIERMGWIHCHAHWRRKLLYCNGIPWISGVPFLHQGIKVCMQLSTQKNIADLSGRSRIVPRTTAHNNGFAGNEKVWDFRYLLFLCQVVFHGSTRLLQIAEHPLLFRRYSW